VTDSAHTNQHEILTHILSFRVRTEGTVRVVRGKFFENHLVVTLLQISLLLVITLLINPYLTASGAFIQ
jgi:hypothetical protein